MKTKLYDNIAKAGLVAVAMLVALPESACAEGMDAAVRNIERASSMIDAVWETSIKGSTGNIYLADICNPCSGESEGVADVWPYTAAIEAHCSLLEALAELKEYQPEDYAESFALYKGRLEELIESLEYYRGTLKLSSYATTGKEWHPYAVPRGPRPGEADVSGILNVYDDQMWLCRELIRAWRLTGKEEYLATAVHLADYVIDGWDCWRDSDGEEYGGITWGPGYNSKHACSNAPVIQPLVWLSDIYGESEEMAEYYYRDGDNKVAHEPRRRGELYLEFARKIYDWQQRHLMHSSGVYYDMLGADNTIKVSRGYRQHVDCGDATGNFFSYNTATMIAGAAGLYEATGDGRYLEDLELSVKGSFNRFTKYRRKENTYEFVTDDNALSGFSTWFNNVLVRSYADATRYVSGSGARNGLDYCQKNLDYAYGNYLTEGMLPIHLIDGWEGECRTKPFHQLAFASEYAVLALDILRQADKEGVADIFAADTIRDTVVYTLTGIPLGDAATVRRNLAPGIYICEGKKIVVDNR